MVMNPGRKLLGLAGLLVALATTHAKELAEYRLGDVVTDAVVTPLPLMVVDPAATATLKEKEAQRIPVIFRHDQSAIAFVEMEVREKFSLARSNFVRLQHSSFHSTRLEPYQLDTEQFNKLMASFRRQNAGFPLSFALAADWAQGRDGLNEQIKLLTRIRQVMTQPIRVDNLTNAPKLGSLVTLVPVARESEIITLEDLKQRGQATPRTNLLTLSRARLAVLELFGPEEADAGRLAARSLRINCFLEAELTQLARARHVEPLFVADHYQAGQVVARAGELVNPKILAAFSQIQEKTITGRLQQQVEQERQRAAQVQESNRVLLGVAVGAGVLLGGIFLWLVGRRRAAAPGLAMTAPSNSDWQERALQAEQKVAQAHDAIRAGALAQLKDKAVSSLAQQRSQMLAAQQAAAAEMADLEQRLNELQAPLQDRLRAYENRIADLEKALAAKGEENRELIRAKIELMRQQLESTRAGGELSLN